MLKDQRQRIEYLASAREFVGKASRLIEHDCTANEYESSLAITADAYLRDWMLALRKKTADEERDLSGVREDAVRIGARLDKIESLFEKIIEQEVMRLASRDRFERTAALQLQALRSAVTLLLSRDPPSLAEKVQAAKAIRDAADPQPNIEAKS
jgi:hypothetical protein